MSQKYIDDLINKGELYLFEIYNKDFSEYSKGTPSLHTLYFKMLFNEKNLENVVYQLNGGAEMFYRKASISENERITHPAKIEIKNKNSCNHKQTSIFDYDLIKDKRFTSYQFSLHLPITLNFKADSSGNFNLKIRKLLKDCDNNYVIGIDRGERNLLYISVIDGKGRIVEQYSLNEIVNEYNGKTYKTDYLSLLEQKEGNRDKARKNWTTIENIKELKEGYMSQVVHKICQLVIKYDAVIALENLNSGFKNSRKKVERQVYQKFEKMLTDKLSYLVDKKLPAEEIGGLLNAYQLTNNSNYTKAGIQNGIIFYIPAWLTSKIDPSTGFVDLLKPRYTNAEAAKDFFSRFRNIEYNASEDMFEFSFRYSDFPKGCTSFKNDWTVCTNGERIRTFRNPKKNNEWDHEYVQLTEEFKKLFESNGIDIGTALKENICSQNKPEFFKELTRLFALTLQMRNSITNNVDVDYLISPVRNKDGRFYDSREYEHDNNAVLPKNADANGAYNIARKVLWAIDVLKNTDDDELTKAKISITNKDWLEYTQR